MPRDWPFSRTRGAWYPHRVRAAEGMGIDLRRVMDTAQRLRVDVFKLDRDTWVFLGGPGGVRLQTTRPQTLTTADLKGE